MTRVNEWHWSDHGRERSQIRAINEMDQELRAERASQHRRLKSAKAEFERGLGRVDSRLDSVSGRLDDLLEWTELRFQLLEFEEYEARKEIRKAFRALAGGHGADAPDLEDVPGYWLPPAATAILPLILRDRPSDAPRRTSVPFTDLQAGLESARDRDPVRAELFNLAAALCFDQPAFVDAAVLRLLGEPSHLGLAEPGQVAEAWRTLWIHAAHGAFGPGASALLTEQLKAQFDPDAFDQDELAAWDQAIRTFGGGEADSLTLDASFARLKEHLTAAVPAAETEPPADDELWRLYLQELIEEPSPAEKPLVTAMEELHHPEDQGRRSAPTWSEPEGTVAELLREDLFAPEGDPALRSLALGLAAPLLRSRIEAIAEAPSAAEPLTRVVKRVGSKVTVRRDGHASEEFENARRRIELGALHEGPTNTRNLVAAGLGVAAVLSAVVQIWFLAVVFALGVAVPLWQNQKAKKEQEASVLRAEQQVADLRAELVRTRELVRDDERKRDERLAANARARDELLEAVKNP